MQSENRKKVNASVEMLHRESEMEKDATQFVFFR